MAVTKSPERRSKIMSLRGAPAPQRTATPVRRKPAPRKRSDGPSAIRTTPKKNHKRVLSTPRNALPGWHDLATGENERHRMRSRHVSFLETISTVRFGLIILAIAAVFTLYVGHVHATRDIVANVAVLKQENLRLHLRYNRLKGEFDRLTGPSVIYQRAGALGLEEGIAYGPTIKMTAQ